MKTPEDALNEWVNDQIYFEAGGSIRYPVAVQTNDLRSYFTREELETVAAAIESGEWKTSTLTVVGKRSAKVPPSVFNWNLIRTFKAYRLPVAPKITAQYLSRFESLTELSDAMMINGVCDPIPGSRGQWALGLLEPLKPEVTSGPENVDRAGSGFHI